MLRRRLSALLLIPLVVLAGCMAPSAAGPQNSPTSALAAPAVRTEPTASASGTPGPVAPATGSPGTLAAATTSATAATPVPPAPTQPAATATKVAPTAAAQPTAGVTAAAQAALAGDVLRLTIVPAGTEARYRVREQLAGRSLPNDAVGRTKAVSGMIALQRNGTLLADQSKIEVDLTTLTSDESRRDRFIQGNTLQTGRFPKAEFVPKAIEGLPESLPAAGEVSFKLSGDMTLRGVTRPATWDVTGRVDGQEFTGAAMTRFTFGDYGMTAPRVAVVLSIEDNIILEVDFLVRQQ